MGVLKSTDGGKSWASTAFKWKANEPFWGFRLAVHPTDPSMLLVAATFGLARITGGGKAWSYAVKGGGFYDVLFHPANPSIVYAASRNAVYRSTDAGQTWTQLKPALPDNTPAAIVFASR